MKKEILPAKVINKHNSLTDGSIPKPPQQVLPDRLLNALYYKFEREGEVFTLTLSELKRLLGLPKTRNDHRIYDAIKILQSPILIRNFQYEGKKIDWFSAPFLTRVIKWKDKTNKLEFKIDPMVIEAIKQKGGYTPLDINVCNRFKTKFGLKLYEMFHRYANLPHRKKEASSRKIGIITKTIEELNLMFGTNYKNPSKFFSRTSKTKPPINRALEEIERVTGEVYYCFYDKTNKQFVFSWGRRKDMKYPTPECIIPTKSIEPFVEWYINHFVDNIQDKKKYAKKMIQRIHTNTMNNIRIYYSLYLIEVGEDPDKSFDLKTNKFKV